MASPPTRQDVRIAYFITSYRSAEQLLRLMKTLRRAQPGAPIVVHLDVFQTPFDSSLFAGMPDIHVMTSDSPIIWGDIDLETVRWRVFRWTLENLDFDWLIMLSEQDYPIAPLQNLENRLATSDADAIVGGVAIEEIKDKQLRREMNARYMYQYTSLPSLKVERRLPMWSQRATTAVRRVLFGVINRLIPGVYIHSTPKELRLPSKFGRRAAKNPFTDEFPCWYYDSWFALSRKAVEHVIDFVDTHPGFVDYYSRTMIPVESATGTILFNDSELRIENAHLTTTIWSQPKSGRPDVIRVDKLDYLFSTGASFARKFDGNDVDVLDELDRVIFEVTDSL